MKPPDELPQAIPQYFLRVDSGATHHMLSAAMFMAYLRDSYMEISWGKEFSTSRASGEGWLVFMTFCAKNRSKPRPIIVTTGQFDTLLVHDVSRLLFASNSCSAQGHAVHLSEVNPGFRDFSNQWFVPFVYETTTNYYLLPAYPPPTQAPFQTSGAHSSPVINWNSHVDNGSYCPLYMRSMPGNSCNAQSTDSGIDNLDFKILPSQNLGEKETNEVSDDFTMGQHEVLTTSQSEYTSSDDEMHQDGSEADDEGDSAEPKEMAKGTIDEFRNKRKRDESGEGSVKKRKIRHAKRPRVDSSVAGPSKVPQSKFKKKRRDDIEKRIARERRVVNLFKRSASKLSVREMLKKAHKKYGHVAVKRLVGW